MQSIGKVILMLLLDYSIFFFLVSIVKVNKELKQEIEKTLSLGRVGEP